MPRVVYVGNDADGVEALGRLFAPGVPVDVTVEEAGRLPATRRAKAMDQLLVAIEAADHHRAAELRDEIVDLDAGYGLLAGDFLVVKSEPSKSKKEGDQ